MRFRRTPQSGDNPGRVGEHKINSLLLFVAAQEYEQRTESDFCDLKPPTFKRLFNALHPIPASPFTPESPTSKSRGKNWKKKRFTLQGVKVSYWPPGNLVYWKHTHESCKKTLCLSLPAGRQNKRPLSPLLHLKHFWMSQYYFHYVLT